jgi:hypothetical protein
MIVEGIDPFNKPVSGKRVEKSIQIVGRSREPLSVLYTAVMSVVGRDRCKANLSKDTFFLGHE